MPRAPSWGGGTSNITMSSVWWASTVSRSPVWAAVAHRSISSRICCSSAFCCVMLPLLSMGVAVDNPGRGGNSSRDPGRKVEPGEVGLEERHDLVDGAVAHREHVE